MRALKQNELQDLLSLSGIQLTPRIDKRDLLIGEKPASLVAPRLPELTGLSSHLLALQSRIARSHVVVLAPALLAINFDTTQDVDHIATKPHECCQQLSAWELVTQLDSTHLL